MKIPVNFINKWEEVNTYSVKPVLAELGKNTQLSWVKLSWAQYGYYKKQVHSLSKGNNPYLQTVYFQLIFLLQGKRRRKGVYISLWESEHGVYLLPNLTYHWWVRSVCRLSNTSNIFSVCRYIKDIYINTSYTSGSAVCRYSKSTNSTKKCL